MNDTLKYVEEFARIIDPEAIDYKLTITHDWHMRQVEAYEKAWTILRLVWDMGREMALHGDMLAEPSPQPEPEVVAWHIEREFGDEFLGHIPAGIPKREKTPDFGVHALVRQSDHLSIVSELRAERDRQYDENVSLIARLSTLEQENAQLKEDVGNAYKIGEHHQERANAAGEILATLAREKRTAQQDLSLYAARIEDLTYDRDEWEAACRIAMKVLAKIGLKPRRALH